MTAHKFIKATIEIPIADNELTYDAESGLRSDIYEHNRMVEIVKDLTVMPINVLDVEVIERESMATFNIHTPDGV